MHELQVYDARFIARSRRLRKRGGDMVGIFVRRMELQHKCVRGWCLELALVIHRAESRRSSPQSKPTFTCFAAELPLFVLF